MKPRNLCVFASLLAGLLMATIPCRAQSDAAMQRRVKILIDKTVHSQTEQQAFADLESLGCAAVPAIIAQMDDRRGLPDPSISLRNTSPQAFEALRHYGPKQVVDALAAILNQMTGRHFEFIYNGATDEERSSEVQAWKTFLRTTPGDKLCPAR